MGKNQRRIVVDGVWRRGFDGSIDFPGKSIDPSIDIDNYFYNGKWKFVFHDIRWEEGWWADRSSFLLFSSFFREEALEKVGGETTKAGQLFRIYRSAWFLISSFLHFLLIKTYESRSPLKRRESSLSPRMKKAHSSPLISVCCGTRILRSSRMLPRILSLLRFAAIFFAPTFIFNISNQKYLKRRRRRGEEGGGHESREMLEMARSNNGGDSRE